ncbi:AraC family transcriptional regulator [Paenibacillaceae bacterium WGS1546]|uniref:AraC family transcriptional regulator n=1 Tax=Cohnella sp. WGS1546 TaxID=3366810 RepID=UPI00372D743A
MTESKRPELERSSERLHLEEAMQIWTRSAISLLDIRRRTIEAAQPLEDYRMPSSMFLCSFGGAADVWLNDRLFHVERFGLFHGGQGTKLSLAAPEQRTECFFLYYRAEEPPFYRPQLKRRLRTINPFRQVYGFAPRQPLFFVEQLSRLHQRWNSATALDHLYAKSVLYRLIYEIYEELKRGDIEALQPDPVALLKQHIFRHFRERVSLQAIAEMFHISPGHLSRLFKKQERMSPQEYLIRTRIVQVQERLTYSEATLREIALDCGFSDEFSLIKSFKTICGMTPGDYRKMSSIHMPDYAMGFRRIIPYAGRGPAWLDYSSEEGESTMFGSSRGARANMLLAATLSAMLLLSACAAPANSSSNSSAADRGNGQQAAVQQTPQEEAQSTGAMRTFEHLGGTTEVPEAPQRIVADWYYGELLTLGVRPIGYPEYLLSEYPYVEPQETEGFGDAVEQIVEMEPDLIISTFDDSYQNYARIAPAVLLKQNDGLFARLRVLGDLVNRKQEAETWIASFEQKLEAARQRIATEAAPDTTVTILNVFRKDLKVNGYRNMGGDVLYNLLQVNPPQRVQEMFDESDAWNYNVSFEVLPEIAGTHIILTAYDPEESGRETLEQLEASKIWRSLDAVKNNRVYKIDYYDLFFDDPIAIEHQIELLTEIIVQ